MFGWTGRCWVLASDQEAVLDRVDAPVLDLGIDRAEAKQFVFGQADVGLLSVGELVLCAIVEEYFLLSFKANCHAKICEHRHD